MCMHAGVFFFYTLWQMGVIRNEKKALGGYCRGELSS